MEQWQQLGLGPNYVPYLSRDIYGNDIPEPDRSNPTRSKHERPLDTIRQFEAAAYGKDFSAGSPNSDVGLSRVESRQSINYERRVNRNSSYSGMSQMQRYSYGNMPDQEYADDGPSEPAQMSGTPSRNVSVSMRQQQQQQQQQYYDQRNQGYGSPVSESGRAQYAAPVPQKLNYQTPPTPPQDSGRGQDKRSSWGKRLSFGKK